LFASAEQNGWRVIEGDFGTGFQDHAPLEPEVALAEWDADEEKVVVYGPVQHVFFARRNVREALGLDKRNVRVIGTTVGGAYGNGRVYAGGKWVGDTKMTQLSIGWQAGAQGYSQIIFFEDKRSYDEFTGGNFEFSADASAVAITAGVSGSAGSTGTSAGASAGKSDATTAGAYRKGMATFTVAKGGLMYEAVLAGQKFSYKAR